MKRCRLLWEFPRARQVKGEEIGPRGEAEERERGRHFSPEWMGGGGSFIEGPASEITNWWHCPDGISPPAEVSGVHFPERDRNFVFPPRN